MSRTFGVLLGKGYWRRNASDEMRYSTEVVQVRRIRIIQAKSAKMVMNDRCGRKDV